MNTSFPKVIVLVLFSTGVVFEMDSCSKHSQFASPDRPQPLLTPQPANNQKGNRRAASAVIFIDPITERNMGIQTAEVLRGPLRRVIRTVAVIDYNETTVTTVTTRYKGWIEKLYVDATGESVTKGEPLLEIYSPDLVATQNDAILAMQAGAGASDLVESALRKLRNYGISENQLSELLRTRRIRNTLQLTAPRNGVVVEKTAVEGQMADAGVALYRLADLSLVWAQSQIYEQDLPNVKLGQEALVRLSYLPDREFTGRVTYIYPKVDENTRTARIRMEFHNPGLFLKPGMFASVSLRVPLEDSAILVPDSAVLRDGEKAKVFVASGGGNYEPREIVLGPRGAGGYYKVASGLTQGERVVTSGEFMLDSQDQQLEALRKMSEPARTPVPPPPVNSPESQLPAVGEREDGGNTPQPGRTAEPRRYVCPMPEHSSILYDHPGQCPICGMTLIPADEHK